MGSKSSPPPVAQQPAVPVVTEGERPTDPANRPVVRRDDADAQASLLAEGSNAAEVDPLTQRKEMAGGSASLIA
jgi:hypothetical protein